MTKLLTLVGGAIVEQDFAIGGGGSVGLASHDWTVAPAMHGHATTTAAVAGVTAASLVLASLAPTADHDADELDGFSVAATPRAGEIEFTLSRPGPIGGAFRVLYQVTNI